MVLCGELVENMRVMIELWLKSVVKNRRKVVGEEGSVREGIMGMDERHFYNFLGSEFYESGRDGAKCHRNM